MLRADRPHSAVLRVCLAVVASLTVLLAPALFASESRAPGWSAWAGPGCAWAAPGEIRVGIVVDFGAEAGAPAGPQVACVVVEQGATSAEVLRVWSKATVGAPRFDVSGLLCAIGGYPETGCGERTDAGYRYWSYWEGGADGWRYSSGNPHVQPARADRVEGWRFQVSSGSGGDAQPPRRAPTGLCADEPSPATTAPATTTSSTTASASVATTASPTPAVTAPAAPAAVITGASPPATGGSQEVSGGDEGAPAPGSPTTSGPDGTADPQRRPVSATSTEAVPVIRAEATSGDLAAASVATGGDGPGSAGAPPVGAVAVAVAIVALGGSAAVRARRRAVP